MYGQCRHVAKKIAISPPILFILARVSSRRYCDDTIAVEPAMSFGLRCFGRERGVDSHTASGYAEMLKMMR